MSVWREQAGVIRDANEVLVGVEMWSQSALSKNGTDGYRFRAGVANGDRVDWIGVLDQAEKSINAGSPTSFIGGKSISRRMEVGQQLVFEIAKNGAPADLSGVAGRFITSLDGSRAGRASALFSAAADAQDPAVRQNFQALMDQLNSAGLGVRNYKTSFRNPASSGDGTTASIVTHTDDDTFSGLSSGTLATQATATISGLDSSLTYIVAVHVTGFIESSSGAAHYQYRVQEDGGAVTGTTHDVHSAGTGVHSVIACNLMEDVSGQTSRTYDVDMSRQAGSGNGSGTVEFWIAAYPKSPVVEVS